MTKDTRGSSQSFQFSDAGVQVNNAYLIRILLGIPFRVFHVSAQYAPPPSMDKEDVAAATVLSRVAFPALTVEKSLVCFQCHGPDFRVC